MREGWVLNNRYRLLEEIGAGGMAVVYRAHDLTLDRPVAIKLMRPQYAGDAAFHAHFQQEARAIARLSHPNIVAVYDVGQWRGRPYIVMEYVPGQNLHRLVAEKGPLPVPQAVDIAIQVCAATGYAHQRGMVHCDLKPHNVILTPEGRVKVTDFGIARAMGAKATAEDGYVWGTPEYLAPEQITGQAVTPATDVYSIGAMLFEMLAGRPPFQAADRETLLQQHLRQAPPPLQELNPRVPSGIAEIVHQALRKDPAARYPTASALGRALIGYRQQGEALTSRQPPLPVVPQGVEKARSAPTPASPGRIILLILLILAALVSVSGLVPLGMAIYRHYLLVPLPPPTPIVVFTPTPTPAPPPMVTVPNLTGLDQDEARRQVEALGLRFAIIGERHHQEIPALAVIEQTVPPGERVPTGTVVGVVISQGPSYVTMPEVVEQPFATEAPKLEELGLQVSRRDSWSTAPVGIIIDQEPQAGVILMPGSTVTLTVSAGTWISLGVNLDDKVLLVGCDVGAETLHPGETLYITLHWQALRRMQESYTVFVHLVGEDGRIWSQRDTAPRAGSFPTNMWQPGEQVRDPYELLVPWDAPPGRYQVRTGMYLLRTMRRLPVLDPGQTTAENDSILVWEVEVAR